MLRLTLRTLLTYLDDALKHPDDVKGMGEKIAESERARELIDRIQKSIRRRGLSVPPLTGGSKYDDANTVAEYLDNELSADQIEEFERHCLEAESHLADVAACHQILSLVEVEPAHVPPTARQRMYRLVRGRESIPYRKPIAAATVPSIDPVEFEAESNEEPLLLGLPPYSRQKGWFYKLVPVGGLLLLLVALVFSVRQALPRADEQGPVVGETSSVLLAALDQRLDADKMPVTQPAAKPTGKPSGQGATTPDPPRAKMPKAEAPKTKALPDTPPKMKSDAPVRIPPKKDAPKPVVPKQPNKGPIAPPQDLPPRQERTGIGQFDSQNTLLVTRRLGSENWERVTLDRPTVFTTDALLSPAGYHSLIVLDSGLQLELWGNLPEFLNLPLLESQVVLYAPPEGYAADLRLVDGRIFLQPQRPGPMRVRVRANQEIWDLTLAGPETRVLVDRYGRYLPGVGFSREEGGQGPTTELWLGVEQGTAQLQIGPKRYPDLNAPTLVVWDSNTARIGQPLPLQPAQAERLFNRSLPKEAQGRRFALESEKALEELSKRLASPDSNLSVVLAENLQDLSPKPSPQALALRVISVLVLESLGDLSALVDFLGNDEHPDLRGAAIFALRHWSGSGRDHDRLLHQVLVEKKGYFPGQADALLTLLHDFSPQQINDANTYSYLLDYMNHEKLPIRELAFWHLSRLDPQALQDPRFLFNAAAPQEQRRAIQQAWRERIPEGELPPRNGSP